MKVGESSCLYFKLSDVVESHKLIPLFSLSLFGKASRETNSTQRIQNAAAYIYVNISGC